MIDLRSDTVTRPTEAMRAAMAQAEVGDDVFGEDPTTAQLELEIATITGKAAALFVSSGTMGNQLGIAIRTRPGDEVIVGEGAHPMHYEAGAAAVLSGVQFAVAGRGGFFTPEEMERALQPSVYWVPRTSLVCLENTHNRAGGRVWPLAQACAVAERARALGLGTHLDGARIWNACAASGKDVEALCAPFDTVSVCFSKGLGAPVGSAFCGPAEAIAQARRLRKQWGGGMRQSGILAAAALYALAHHRVRLTEDHTNARRLAERMGSLRGVRIDIDSVETNLVNVDLDASASAVAHAAAERGVLILATGPNRLRAVTHLDVSSDDVEVAADVLEQAIRNV